MSDSGKGGDGAVVVRSGISPKWALEIADTRFAWSDSEANLRTMASKINAAIAAGFVRKEEYDRLNGNMKVTQSLLDKAAAALPDDPTELEDMKEKLEALRRVAGEMAECFKQIKPEYLNTFFFPSDLERVLAKFDAWDKQNREGRV